MPCTAAPACGAFKVAGAMASAMPRTAATARIIRDFTCIPPTAITCLPLKASAHGGGTRDSAQDRRRGIAGGAPFPVSHAASVMAPATSVPCVRPERYASPKEGAIGTHAGWAGRRHRWVGQGCTQLLLSSDGQTILIVTARVAESGSDP